MVSKNELLKKTCEYITIVAEVSQQETTDSKIAEKVLSGELTDDQIEFAIEILSGDGSRMEYVKSLITKPSEKEYTYSYNNPTEYFPSYTPMDDRTLYNGDPHYVYIHSEVQGRYGETYWFSNNCSKSLGALPTIKAFKEYDFEVGKFYKITCVDEITWGNGKKKYIMDIQEASEEDFIYYGLRYDAYDNGYFDKCYMEDIIRQHQKMQ